MASSPAEAAEKVEAKALEYTKQQQRAFTAWCNDRLRSVDLQISTLDRAFGDGIALLQLFGALTGERTPKPDAGRLRVHRIANVVKALDFMKARGVALNTISAEEIVDGNVKLILGMLWLLILHFDIKDIKIEDSSSKDALLRWCQLRTESYEHVRVERFESSFNDGLALCSIIHSYRPDLIDIDQLSKDTPLFNLQVALGVAETYFRLPHILDAEDFLAGNPDKTCVMTLVSALYRYFTQEPKHKPEIEEEVEEELEENLDIPDLEPDYDVSDSSSSTSSDSKSTVKRKETLTDDIDNSPSPHVPEKLPEIAGDIDELTKPPPGYVNEAFDRAGEDGVVISVDENSNHNGGILIKSADFEILDIDCDMTNNARAYSSTSQRLTAVTSLPSNGNGSATNGFNGTYSTMAPPGETENSFYNFNTVADDDLPVCCCSCCRRFCCFPWLASCCRRCPGQRRK